MNEIDVEAWRALTPGCANGLHFNHAGASLPSAASLSAINEHLLREALLGPMEAGAAASDAIEHVRRDAATLLGAQPDEIAFASSGSSAWGSVFAALPPLRRGERILVGRQEWGGNLASMRLAADRAGASVEIIPCNEDGSVDANALATMIDARVRLVSLTWLPANGGLINDAVAVGRVANAAGVPYFVDAGQALGQLPVDVHAIGCDLLKGAGRKYLRGPRGTALLYLRRGFAETLTPGYVDVASVTGMGDCITLRPDARRFEHAETAIALLLGLGVAVRECLQLGLEPIRARVRRLADSLRAQLADIGGVQLQDLGTEQSGLVAFSVGSRDVFELRQRLAERGVRVGANKVPYTPLDMQARGLDGVVRASVSWLNTDEEIARLVREIAAVAQH